MKKFNKKIIVVMLVITFVFSPFLANKAEAFWPVIDYTMVAKEYGIDGVAGMVVNQIIERMSRSVVDWINKGFKGNPAFVTNPETYFTNMGDNLAGQFIFGNPNLSFLCGPISAKIKLALTNSYAPNESDRWQCTLTQVGQNMDDFMNNFENGGWDSFFEITQRQQNNPLGAYIQAESEMYLQLANQQNAQKEELNQGSGFLSYKECKPGTETPAQGLDRCDNIYNNCVRVNANNESKIARCSADANACRIAQPQAGDCAESDKITNTPGSVIESKLNEQLGMGQTKLAAADEINEMVSALLNQLISQVVGGIGKGLRSLSQPNSSDEGKTFTEKFSNTTAAGTTDYFGNKQNTSVLEVPVPGSNPICDPNNTSYNPVDPACNPSTTPATNPAP